MDVDELREEIKKKIEYGMLATQYEREDLDGLVELDGGLEISCMANMQDLLVIDVDIMVMRQVVVNTPVALNRGFPCRFFLPFWRFTCFRPSYG